MTWTAATIVDARPETARSRTLSLGDGWPHHSPGQHIDVRLTAEDGYTAVRSYSIASSSADRTLEITVDRLDDGEVSPYLVDVAEVGTQLEVRGPTGGWFVWDAASTSPVQLIGGGSGIVPLMAMIRTHADVASTARLRLLYAVRSPEAALFRSELLERAASDPRLDINWAFSRETPKGWEAPPARLTRETVLATTMPPSEGATVFICGATPFVEAVAGWLVEGGYDPIDIRTERYGG